MAREISEAVAAVDEARVVTYWNAAAERLLGIRADEALGRPIDELLPQPPEARASIDLFFDGVVRTGRWQGETAITGPGGVPVSLKAVVTRLGDASGAPAGFLAVASEVSVQAAERDALRRSQEQYRSLFESNPGPMLVYDDETLSILAANDAAVALYGYERDELLSMTIEELRSAEDRPGLHKVLAIRGQTLRRTPQTRHRRKDGEQLWVQVTSHDVRFEGRAAHLVLLSDLTERRNLEDRYLQAQKMEAVGRLAGGVAHDFNNLLTVINGYSELALVTISGEGPLAKSLKGIRQAGERAATLTKQLLAFSRKQVFAPRHLDLNGIVADVETILRRLIGEDVELITVLSPHLGLVVADPAQVEQVLLNLAVNARDAMPSGGTLTIRTALATLTPHDVRELDGCAPGSYVVLEVSDTGTGLSADARLHLFEPFFTTKEKGRGTGLGLATVYGIVRQSEGGIRVESEPGRGTTFRVYLPRRTDASGVTIVDEKAAPGASSTCRVLLVEDDPSVRSLTRQILEEAGFAVEETANAGEAFAAFDRLAGRFALVLADAVMPGTSGPELVQRLRERVPELKVLVISGDSEEARAEPKGTKELAFLQKPFTPAGLVRRVREVLAAG